MLPPRNRLKSREDFFAVSRKGRSYSSGVITVRLLKNQKEASRIGFSVGLKFSKKSVERNAVKRKLRALAGGLLPKFGTNVDVIVLVRRPAGGISGENLGRDLAEAFKKSGLIN